MNFAPAPYRRRQGFLRRAGPLLTTLAQPVAACAATTVAAIER
jgi:hypothetical protein